MGFTRAPRAELATYVERVWCGESNASGGMEHVLPSGGMHVVLRLSGPPVRIGGQEIGYSLVGGVRSSFYVKDVSAASSSVGAVLKPGGSMALLGVPAVEFTESHTLLDDVWGHDAAALRERLMEASDAQARLRIFEAALLSRLRVVTLAPAVRGALDWIGRGGAVGEAVVKSGFSHRHFNALFRDAVGLTPKVYGRVQRFHSMLRGMSAGAGWAEIAIDAGYSDQAHFCREFLAFSGVTPGEYARAHPAQPLHFRRSNSFKTARS
ncbi:MAG: AraC family transcriptional regulator [Bryobacteraceae bacterium]